MIIQNNIPALNTFRQMGVNIKGTSKALEKLSSGLRINRAGDDAAGLAISEKMRAQVRGLNRASDNAQDGISLIQSADSALQEVHAILRRMRELSIQAANDVNERVDRQAIQDEINQLIKEIDRISATTEFNKMTILDGSLSTGKYIKAVSGFNVSGVSLTNPNEAVNGITSIAVTESGDYFNMTFDFSLDNQSYAVMNGKVQNGYGAVINITISNDVAISAGLTPPVSAAVSVNEGDTENTITGNIRDLLTEQLGESWKITSAGGKLNIEAKYIGRFGCAAVGEGWAGAFQITAVPDEIFETSEWRTGDICLGGIPATDNVSGTIGRDMTVAVDGEPAKFTNSNFMEWTGRSANIHSPLISETTGILRWKDAYNRLYLYDGEVSSHNTQFSFKIDDPSRLSGAIIATRDGRELTLQIGANTGYAQTARVAVGSLSAVSLGVSELNMHTHQDAQNAIASVDGAIQIISDQRAELGAVQNRLEHTIYNLDTVSENLQDAESRLRDTDMAKEMMKFTKNSILLQSSQAMIAQANNLPQGVLQLLS